MIFTTSSESFRSSAPQQHSVPRNDGSGQLKFNGSASQTVNLSRGTFGKNLGPWPQPIIKLRKLSLSKFLPFDFRWRILPIGSIKGLLHSQNISILILSMSSRHQITDHKSFEAFRHRAFVQAVNRAANLKCLEAIKSGKLRAVAPQPISSTPSEYTPRYVQNIHNFHSFVFLTFS